MCTFLNQQLSIDIEENDCIVEEISDREEGLEEFVND